MKRIFGQNVGMIAVAAMVLALCGCPHSPGTNNENLTWTDFDLGDDVLPAGWELMEVSEDNPAIDKTPWWIENPIVTSSKEVLKDVPGDPEEVYACFYKFDHETLEAFVVIAARYATPEEAGKAYEVMREEGGDITLHGRYVVMLKCDDLTDNVRRIRAVMLKKLGLPVPTGDEDIRYEIKPTPKPDSVKGGVSRRGNIVVINSDLDFSMHASKTLLGLWDFHNANAGDALAGETPFDFDIAEYPYWYARASCDRKTDLTPYIKEAVEGEFFGVGLTNAVTDAQLLELTKDKELHILYLPTCMKVTDAGVVHLESFPELIALTIASQNLTDDSMTVIGRMEKLQYLKIYWTSKVTDAGVEKLSGLKNLKALSLTGMPVNDKFISAISKFDGLEVLELMRNEKITDKSLDVLAGMKGLKRLDLRDCSKITAAKVKWLKEQLPDCQISS